jgi:glycosyltransferase involved in cell wall biosynthesis
VKVAIIHPYDPAASYASGIRTAISGFIRVAPADWSIRVIGCTADASARPVGARVEVAVGDRAIEFVPIMAAHPTRRSRIPMSLRFCWQLLRRRHHIDLRDAHLIFHRLETAWPLIDLPNSKLVFIHYDVAKQILDPNSPVLWRRFPRLYLWLEGRILRRIDQIRSPTADGVSWLSNRYPDLVDRIRFLPSFADSDFFEVLPEPSRLALREQLAREHGIDFRAPLGLFVGRFDPQKDPLLLLRAWRALEYAGPAPVLVLIGEGALEAEMRAFIDSEALGDRVRFAGSLSAEGVGRWMNAADVLVMTAAIEAMSMAMLESLRCGLPVVAPDIGEASRLIAIPEAGRLVAERSAEVFARAIADVLKQPRDRALCASRAAPYTPERVFEPIFSLIRQGDRGAAP